MAGETAATVRALRDVLAGWEELLAGMGEDEIVAPQTIGEWSIKDTVAHLWAWQQVSIARFEAAQDGTEPRMPVWLHGANPDSDDELQDFNARIRDAYDHMPWSRVREDWRSGFRRFLEMADQIPEAELTDATKYPWLNGNALIAVLQGSLDHHREHLEDVLAARP